MEFVNADADRYFGLALTTHRDNDSRDDAVAFFQYECVLAGIAVCFCRWSISKKEPPLLRGFFALLLGLLAYSKQTYELICAVHVFSYAVPYLFRKVPDKSTRLAFIGVSAGVSFLLSHVVLSKQTWLLLVRRTPTPIAAALNYFFPIEEIYIAYEMLRHFMNPAILNKQIAHLFFATFHIQVGMGYLGIAFLTKEQSRRNQLVRMDMQEDDQKQQASKRFQNGAAPFILLTAVPYMLQIIFMGNVNRFAFFCVQHDLHRAVRLNNVFDNDSHLIAMSNDSATTSGSKSNVKLYASFPGLDPFYSPSMRSSSVRVIHG
jgi:hypothetical protein